LVPIRAMRRGRLMCGRPASCRPDAFASSTEHFFPLTTAEKAMLVALYPPARRAQ
jgi:hypothetical protein